MTNRWSGIFFLQKTFGNIEWKNDQAIVGNSSRTKRKVGGLVGQIIRFEYTYPKSPNRLYPGPMSLNPESYLLKKHLPEKHTQLLALLNLLSLTVRRNGLEHSDGEKASEKRNGSIASMVFGAVRKFTFSINETCGEKKLESHIGAWGVYLKWQGNLSNALASSPFLQHPKGHFKRESILTFRTIVNFDFYLV